MNDDRLLVGKSGKFIVDKDGKDVAYMITNDNRETLRRLVAAYNACRGISTEKLESYVASGKTIQPAVGD